MDLLRKPNESDLEYHKRIIYGKLEDKTLQDLDYSELAELVYGKQYSSDVARRMMYGSCRTLKLIDESKELTDDVSSDLLSVLDTKRIELQKERQKFYDQRNAFNKIVRERSRQEELNEIISDAIGCGDLPVLPTVAPPHFVSDNDMLVSLNDIHYGATENSYWNTYNSDICKTMMSNYCSKIIEVACRHNSQNCIVWANGDLISGNCHNEISVTNKENIIEQITGVSELISQFLVKLSEYFVTVKFVSVAGNHSRLDTKERALKDERLDDLVEWYLRARLQNYENIIVGADKKIDTTMYLINVRGLNYCGVHGDYDLNDSKVQTLQTMVGVPLYAVLSGHLHHNKTDEVQGIKTVMAGSFLGMDKFCVAKRIYGKPSQMICICNEDGIECSYDVPLKKIIWKEVSEWEEKQ